MWKTNYPKLTNTTKTPAPHGRFLFVEWLKHSPSKTKMKFGFIGAATEVNSLSPWER